VSILSVLHDVKQQSGAIGLNGWRNVTDNIAPEEAFCLLGAFRSIGAFQRILVHFGAIRAFIRILSISRIGAHIAAFRRKTAHFDEKGRISAQKGANRRIMAHL
jgi:hypothetical protein